MSIVVIMHRRIEDGIHRDLFGKKTIDVQCIDCTVSRQPRADERRMDALRFPPSLLTEMTAKFAAKRIYFRSNVPLLAEQRTNTSMEPNDVIPFK